MIGILILAAFVGGAVCQSQCGSIVQCGTRGPAVCGTDHHTYANKCQLSIYICFAKLQHRHIGYLHSGSCGSGGPVTTRPQLACHEDTLCDEEVAGDSKFCMSNGKTAESQCDLKNQICTATHNHTHLSVLHQGECTNTTDCHHLTRCPHDVINMVCASNGYNYINDCYFQQAKCHLNPLSNKTLEVLHAGKCNDTSTSLARTVDCAQFADMSLAGLAVEGGASNVYIKTCPYVSSLANTTVCVGGVSYRSECQFCSRMASLHKLTYDMLTADISYDGRCHFHPVVGKK